MFFFNRKLWRAIMSLQDQINALTSRLDTVAKNVATIEAAAQPAPDLTALTAEVTSLESVVNAGLSSPAATALAVAPASAS